LKLSVNGGSFQTQSYIDEMLIQTNRIVISVGEAMATSFMYDAGCSASVGNFSFFDRPLSIRDVKSIFDLDKDLYEPGIIQATRTEIIGGAIVPKSTDKPAPVRDRRIKPPLNLGLMFDVKFNDNTLINDFEYDGTIVGFDGVSYTPNDGFVSVDTGGFLELDGTLPNNVAQSITDQSWLVQFKAVASSGQNVKMILTTFLPGTASSGLQLLVSDMGVSAIYYKGPNAILVNTNYIIDASVDLTVGIHQAVITYAPATQTLNIFFDDDEAPQTSIAPTDEPIFYGAGSTIVLNKLSSSSPPDVIEYHRVSIYNRVLSQGEIFNIYK